ncbi:MAG: 4Fe-4S ferredoxin iron-sulfur binding domain protein [Sphingobacterium sp.]|jgi:hypothetical protein|nr:4Fe-4S ferredoxin iron-sulfur binding domain protein [Sphingobacterium sp.]
MFSCKKGNNDIPTKPKAEVQDSTDGIFGAIKKNSDSIRFLPFIGPSLKLKTYDGANQTTHPSVLYFPEKWNKWKLWMVHTPYPFSRDYYENPSIAVSNDGVNWTTPVGLENPLDYCEKKDNDNKYHYSDGALVFREDLNILECWYRYSKNGVLEQIWRKTSKDGITWTKKELVIETDAQPKNMVMSPAVIWEDGKYKMWAVTASPFRVQYREGVDGIKWTNPINLKIPLPKDITAWHVEVKKTDLGYEMLLNVSDNRNKEVNTKFLMSSLSTNGLDWDEFKPSIVLPDQKDKWNGKMIYRSSFIKIDKLYIVYYSAMAHNFSWGLGIAMGNSLQNLTY